jgi:hypothetical protein
VIEAPSVIQAAGHPPKRIEEYAGLVNSGHANVSVARMQSPPDGAEYIAVCLPAFSMETVHRDS